MRNLKKPFKEADKEDVKRFAAWLAGGVRQRVGEPGEGG